MGMLPNLLGGMYYICTVWESVHMLYYTCHLHLSGAVRSFMWISPHTLTFGHCSLLDLCPPKHLFLLTMLVVPALSINHIAEGFCGLFCFNKSFLRNGFVLNPYISMSDGLSLTPKRQLCLFLLLSWC